MKRICKAGVDETRYIGRLCTRWLDGVRKTLNEKSITIHEVEGCIVRARWRSIWKMNALHLMS